jgi:hypothetical protein
MYITIRLVCQYPCDGNLADTFPKNVRVRHPGGWRKMALIPGRYSVLVKRALSVGTKTSQHHEAFFIENGDCGKYNWRYCKNIGA